MHRAYPQTAVEHNLTCSNIAPGLAHIPAFRDHRVNPHLVALGSCVLDTNDGVGTIRHRSASHDSDRLAFTHRDRRDLTGRYVGDNFENSIGFGDIRGAHRETVHGRVGKVGHVVTGDDRLGQDPADALVERNRLAVERSHRFQHFVANGFEGSQFTHPNNSGP